MSKTKTIELFEPIKDHRGAIKKIVLREPKYSDFIDLGMPTTRGFLSPTVAADFRRRRRPFLGRGSSAPFGSAPETWAALQLDYDMAQAMKHAHRNQRCGRCR